MPLADTLPTQERVNTILGRITGSDDGGSGLKGASGLLADIDPSSLGSSVTTQLSGSLSMSISSGAANLTTGVRSEFSKAFTSIPTDPAELAKGFTSRLEVLKGLSADSLPDLLSSGARGFADIRTAIPVDSSQLLSGVTAGLEELRTELLSGAFGELKHWSETTRGLWDQISPLIAGGAGAVEDRVIDFVAQKISELVADVLPRKKGPAEIIGSSLDAAISAERLAAIATLKSRYLDLLGAVREQFAGGDFSDGSKLAEARSAFEQLTVALADVQAKLDSVLSMRFAEYTGLIELLQKQLEDYAAVEVVDISKVREKISGAIDQAIAAVEKVGISSVRTEIESVFGKIRDIINQPAISQFAAQVGDCGNWLRAGLDLVDAGLLETVASVRDVFSEVRNALDSTASTLGEFDANGQFHFRMQQQIEDFLNSIKANLEETVQPLLDQFQTSVTERLQQVADGLNAVHGEIEAVKNELVAMLQGVDDSLTSLNVPAKIEEISGKLDDVLAKLGDIDFNVVVDPVIEEINKLRDELVKIDRSSLSGIALTALDVALEVVLGVDFASSITAVLMEKMDEILAVPRAAIAEMEGTVEGILDRFSRLGPDVLLSPLDDVFKPVTEALGNLDVTNLTSVLDEWHKSAIEEVSQVSPSVLLAPVMELYDQLADRVASVSPDRLVEPLENALDDLKGGLDRLDVQGSLGSVEKAFDETRGLLEGLSPEKLLAPVTDVFDKMVAVLDGFKPSSLLEPLRNAMDTLTEPLAKLKPKHVQAIGTAFAPLRSLPLAFDPEHNLQSVRRKYEDARGLIQQLDVGKILVELKSSYDGMKAQFDSGGAAGAVLSATVDSLNPLRDEALGKVATGFQQLQSRLQSAVPQSAVPADLMTRYTELKPRIEGLVPTWIRDDMTPESVRQAVALVNPLNIGADLDRTYQAFMDQFRALDPRVLGEGIQGLLDEVIQPLSSIDISAIATSLQETWDELIRKLDSISVGMLSEELQEIFGRIQSVISGLDPRPVAEQLDGLATEVKEMLVSLKPSEVLQGLNEPLTAAKEIVKEFDPADLKAPLQEAFESIQAVLKGIDVGVLLQPVTDRLDELRGELEAGLDRTSCAFDEMLAAARG